MTQFAIITIELPLDGGTQEDAQVLANHIAKTVLTTSTDHPWGPSKFWRLYGRVTSVCLEQRGMGRNYVDPLYGI